MKKARIFYSHESLLSFTASWRNVFIILLMLAVVPSAVYGQKKFISIGKGSVSQVIVSPGKTLTITTDRPFGDLVVGNAGVADVLPLSDRSLYIQGNQSGFTNVSIYDGEKNLLGIIDVRVRLDFSEIRQAIRSAVPSAKVQLTNINNKIRISGDVKDAVDLRQVIEIAEQYTAGPVINSIRVLDAQQVMLKVRVLEVNRSAGRDLGIDLKAVKAGNVKFESGSGTEAGASNGAPFGTFVGNLLAIAGTRIDIVINALEAKGLARRLANPRLIAMSGTEAKFLAGGEIPIVTTSTGDNGNVSSGVTYREYGIKLKFRPTVLDNGLIHLVVEPEVSDIDSSYAVDGHIGFLTRKASTTVQLRDGQSFAIAGLLKSNNDRSIKQLPWLGQLPIIGALFRSTTFTKKESDLVIVVTPTIVRPASPDEPLSSPLDQTRSSDDVELYLMGLLEVDKNMIRRFHDGEGIIGQYGHILDLGFEDQYVVKK